MSSSIAYQNAIASQRWYFFPLLPQYPKKTTNKTKQHYKKYWLKWTEGINDIQSNDSTILIPGRALEGRAATQEKRAACEAHQSIDSALCVTHNPFTNDNMKFPAILQQKQIHSVFFPLTCTNMC